MRRSLFLVVLGVLLVGAWYTYAYRNGLTIQEVFFADYDAIQIGEIPINVEVVNTPDERKRGLSGRNGLDDASGMLFIFEESDYHGIWMKDMLFPIDVIWIDENFKIVHIVDNMDPASYPEIYEPDKPAKYILEANALLLEIYGASVGNEVYIPEKILRAS